MMMRSRDRTQEAELPRLWSRWDPSMDGFIEMQEFLGPRGLLSFLRKHFSKVIGATR